MIRSLEQTPQYPIEIALYPDILVHLSLFMDAHSLFTCSSVSKAWNKAILENRAVWQIASAKEGIPCVKAKDKTRNFKKDFKDIYPITISACLSHTFLKIPFYTIPFINRVFLAILDMADPFEETKTVRDNYLFVVVPPKTSIKNLKTLCEAPIDGIFHRTVFNPRSMQSMFDQLEPLSDETQVYLMRKASVAKGLFYDMAHVERCVLMNRDVERVFQKDVVENVLGFEVMSITARVYANSMCIMNGGTCFDIEDPKTEVSHYVRGPEVALNREEEENFEGEEAYFSCTTGGYTPEEGLFLDYNDETRDDKAGPEGESTGVVPCISVAVRPKVKTT
ncbi:MAG: F-box protein [Verrucomicrobia bacterium]|nr:F-box protein [Verrucomicrobiota bacterium]